MKSLMMKLYDRFLFRRDAIKRARSLGVRVGSDCRFIGVNRSTFGSEPYLIRIGDHVTIAAGTQFVTHDGGVWVFRNENPDIDVFGAIVVGNNVFVGYGSIILPGTIIEDNVVVGAGSVVKGVLTNNSVWAGVPARRVMSIDEYREKVLKKAEYVRNKPSSVKDSYIKEKYMR